MERISEAIEGDGDTELATDAAEACLGEFCLSLILVLLLSLSLSLSFEWMCNLRNMVLLDCLAAPMSGTLMVLLAPLALGLAPVLTLGKCEGPKSSTISTSSSSSMPGVVAAVLCCVVLCCALVYANAVLYIVLFNSLCKLKRNLKRISRQVSSGFALLLDYTVLCCALLYEPGVGLHGDERRHVCL